MDMEASFGHMQAMEFIWPAAARFQCCMAARQIAGFGQPSRVVTVCRCAHCASSPHSSVATMVIFRFRINLDPMWDRFEIQPEIDPKFT